MNIFQKVQWLNLWWHAVLVVLPVTVLVGFRGYRIIVLPMIFIYGMGDGYPSTADKATGVLIAIGMAVIAVCIAYLLVTLFVRLFSKKIRSAAFRTIFIGGLLFIFCANFFAMWKANHEEWKSATAYIAINAAMDKDDSAA